MGEWESYNTGYAKLTFFDLQGNPYNGDMKDFENLHTTLSGFRNKISDTVILINHYGDVAARGTL
jgi:hypothetical protein